MNKLQQILDNYPEESFIKLDGLDDAIIGVETSQEPFRLVYSINDIVDCFVEQGLTPDEAIENYEYNTARAIPYITNAPILIYTDFF